MDSIYLGSLSYALGEDTFDLEESALAGRLSTSVEDLADAGFRRHRACPASVSVYDLARAAVGPLADTGALTGVSAIIYATCLPQNGNVGDPAEWLATHDVRFLVESPASRLQAAFSLDDAIVIGMTQQACTTLLGAI